MKTYLFVLISIIVLSVFSCKQKEPTLVCHTENLRIRLSDNTDAKVIGKLSKGEQVKYRAEWGDSLKAVIDNNNLYELWIKIETDSGKIGWVFSGGLTGDTTYIKLENFNNKASIKDSVLYVPFGKTVNFYTKPFLASSIINKINEPTALIIEAEAEINFTEVGIKGAG